MLNNTSYLPWTCVVLLALNFGCQSTHSHHLSSAYLWMLTTLCAVERYRFPVFLRHFCLFFFQSEGVRCLFQDFLVLGNSSSGDTLLSLPEPVSLFDSPGPLSVSSWELELSSAPQGSDSSSLDAIDSSQVLTGMRLSVWHHKMPPPIGQSISWTTMALEILQ